MPDQYWVYASTHKSHYVIFAIYSFLTIIFVCLYMYFLNRRFQKKYQDRFAALEEACFEKGNAEKVLKKELGAYQLEAQAHLTACKTYKKIYSQRMERQKEYANRILISLGSFQKLLKTPHEEIRNSQLMEALRSCLNEFTVLSQGLWQPIKKEAIDFKIILDDIQRLFSEKIHKSAIKVEINIESHMSAFLGDPVLMEALLINVIGKSLHRVPKYGTVSIELKEGVGFLYLEIQDNGFAGAEAAERLIRKPFELFMAEEVLHQACLSNGIKYKFSKNNDGSNITHLIMPVIQKEDLNNNVVQLFP